MAFAFRLRWILHLRYPFVTSVGVPRRYGARLLRGRARVQASLTHTPFIFALISSDPPLVFIMLYLLRIS
jgi:hypothetical protein